MKPLASHEITGTWAALLLPIDQDDAIDFARLGDEIDALIASGVDGIYSNGTAGEFYSQSESEFDRVSEMLATRCEMAGVPFQIGVSHTGAQASLERLRRTRDLRPGAVQVILPDWFKVTDAEALAFLERMAAEAAPVGLVLYNPPHAKRLLPPQTIAMLASHVDALVGVKVSPAATGPANLWFAALGDARSRLSIFTPGHFLHQHVPLGSDGSYSNVACLSPRGATRWHAQMKRDLPTAQDVGRRLIEFFTAHVTPFVEQQGYSHAAADKFLAAIGGWSDVGTRVRWPYQSIPQEHAVRLRPIAQAAIPELLQG